MAKTVLLRQNDFEPFRLAALGSGETACLYRIEEIFDIKDNLLVFHISKVACAIENPVSHGTRPRKEPNWWRIWRRSGAWRR